MADPTLVKWAKRLKCNNLSDLVKPGRKLLSEVSDAQVREVNNEKVRDGHLLMCSDAIVLAVVSKSRFGRKRFDLVTLRIVALIVSLEPELGIARIGMQSSEVSEEVSPHYEVKFQQHGEFKKLEEYVHSLDRDCNARGTQKPVHTIEASTDTNIPDDAAESQRALEKKSRQSNENEDSQNVTVSDLGTAPSTRTEEFRLESTEKPASEMSLPQVLPKDLSTKSTSPASEAILQMILDTTTNEEGEPELKSVLPQVERHSLSILRMILESEQQYSVSLNRLVEDYLKPLRIEASKEEGSFVTTADINLIFNNVESIHKINLELYQELEGGINALKRPLQFGAIAGVFATAFSRVLPFLKTYSEYSHHYGNAVERIVQLEKSSKEFSAFLESRNKQEIAEDMTLEALLRRPVVRIAQYSSLFGEALQLSSRNEFEPTNSEATGHFAALEETRKEIQVLADSISSKVNDAENQDMVLQIFHDLGLEPGCPGLITPSRRIHRNVEVLMREAPFTSNRRQKYRLYLFNDLIVFAKFQGRTHGSRSGPLNRTLLLSEKLRGTLGSSKHKLKVTHSFSLSECNKVKKSNYVDEDNRHAFEIRRIIREGHLSSHKSASGSTSSGAAQLATKIQRFEVWCETKMEVDTLAAEIDAAVDLYKHFKGSNSNTSATKGKTRAWAIRTRPRQWNGSSASEASQLGTERNIDQPVSKASPFSRSTQSHHHLTSPTSASSSNSTSTTKRLSDIDARVNPLHESRYRTRTKKIPGELKTISVSFPLGPLGIALENSDSPKGVLVACVAGLSVADRNGVSVGDRIIAINGNHIDEDATWVQVVDTIKGLERPIQITFERTVATITAGNSKATKQEDGSSTTIRKTRLKRHSLGSVSIGSSNASQSGSDSPRNSVTSMDGAATRSGQRQWAAKLERRKALHGTSRILSLQELEAFYSASESALTNAHPDSLMPIFDAALRNAKDGLQSSKKEARLIKVMSILKEILVTEHTYVCALRKLIGDYMLPLRQARGASLTPDDEQAIFLNVEGIVHCNTALLKGITSKLSLLGESSTVEDLVSLFSQEILVVVPFFQVYTTYCHKYSSALSKLIACRQANPQLESFMTQRENRAENKHDSLQSLLIKPVQRICKYPLLMRSLRDAVDSLKSFESSRREQLESATLAVESLATKVNEKVSEAESVEKVILIYNQFNGDQVDGYKDLVAPHRTFVARFDVNVVKAVKYESKPQSMVLLLFKDIMLLVESKKRGTGAQEKETFKFLHRIDLRKCDIKLLASSSTTGGELSSSTPRQSDSDQASVFQITQVTRIVLNATGSEGQRVTGKVSTNIDKFRVKCTTPAECIKICSVITDTIAKVHEDDAKKPMVNVPHLSHAANMEKSPSPIHIEHQDGRRSEIQPRKGIRSWNARRKSSSQQMSLEAMEKKYH